MSILSRLFQSKPKTDYAALLKSGAIIIDVRSPYEFNSGHIDKSINIPLDRLSAQVGQLKSKKIPIITVCRSGNRSAVALRMLESAGITAVNGGAWTSLQKQINP